MCLFHKEGISYGYKIQEEERSWCAGLLGDHAENGGKRMTIFALQNVPWACDGEYELQPEQDQTKTDKSGGYGPGLEENEGDLN